MDRTTYYVVLPFARDESGDLVAGEPLECPNAGKANRVAAALAVDPKFCGAIAFSRTGNPALGDFDDAVLINAIGEVDPMALGG